MRQAGLPFSIRSFLSPAAALVLLALLAPTATAHAVLLSATPAPNGYAKEGIDTVEFVFTEDVEREYTNADLIDLAGTSLKVGAVEFDEERHNVIRIRVEPLASGLYSASWRALSVDTHTTRGSFVFAVGNATLRPGQYEVIVDETPFEEVARDGFARFAFFAGLFLALGLPVFSLLVLRDPRPPRALFASGATFGAVGVAGAGVTLLLLAERTGLGSGVLDTAPGRSLAMRAALLLGAAAACALAAWRPQAWRPASYAAIGLGILATIATATGSHAASAQEMTTLLVAADAVHLLMGAVWIGGIVAFLHVGWGRSALDVAAMIVRFSPLAMASVGLLLATGFLASYAHMPCAATFTCHEELRTERYVGFVLLKLALMVPLVALGAYHKFLAGPRLARAAYSPRTFTRVVAIEAIVMAVVLGAAGMLAASAPPQEETQTGEVYQPYLELDNFTKKSHVIVQISPNPVAVGLQELVVIVHPLGPTLPNSTTVAIKVWPAGEREPDLVVELEKVTPNEWEIESGLFTQAGDWNLLVLLQRPDEFVKVPFTVPVVNPGTPS